MCGNERLEAPRGVLSRRRALFFVVGLFVAGALLAACGGGSSGSDETAVDWPSTLELGGTGITPLVLNHQLAVSDTRFLLGLLDEENALLLGANVDLRFFKLEGERGTLKATAPADYVSMKESVVHEHADGTLHTHEGTEVGGYVAHVGFDSAGRWGVEVSGAADGREFGPLRYQFEVFEDTPVPDIGEPAPRTKQLTLRDVDEISEIDTSNPPHPEMHELTVAEALDTGRPVLVAFATPAFCTSRVCGPVMDDVVVPLFERYSGQVEFVHIEPYRLQEARTGQGLMPVDELAEWGLQTEPWIFVIDSEGRIAGKFEGITSVAEVDTALEEVLG